MNSFDMFGTVESTEPNCVVPSDSPRNSQATETAVIYKDEAPSAVPLPLSQAIRDRMVASVPMFGALLAATILIAHGIQTGEFNLNVDESFNAFTGLFFADFFRHLPLAHPVQYTYLYYAHYPAIELLHWPPLLHAVEGVVFLLFGPSVLTARLTVLAFALFGLVFWFKLVAELENRWAAFLSTILLALLPQVLVFEKAVMLEVPCLALCIAASYYWVRYLREAKSSCLYAFAVLAGLALITKQLSGYLAIFCILSAVATGRWRLLVRRPMAWARGMVLLIAGPFYALSLAMDWRSISGNVFKGADHVAHPFLFYLSALPHQLGWPVLVLALLGIMTCPWWCKRENATLMLSWIVACSCMVAFLATKDFRYTIYLLPPLVYFAAAPFASHALSPKLRVLGLGAALVLMVAYSVKAWRFERPYVSGYAAAAERVSHFKDSPIILYDGDMAANFMFFLRLHDPAGHFVVLRKALYATAVMKRFGAEELIQTPDQLEAFIAQNGIKYVVVEDPVKMDFDIQRTLRDLLNSSRFRLLQAFPIASNVPSFKEKRLLVYENAQPVTRSAQFLRIRMLTLGHDIILPLDDGK